GLRVELLLPTQLARKESVQLVRTSDSDASERLLSEVFWACPTGGRPQGRPRMHWRDYISWSGNTLGSSEREVWVSLLILLPWTQQMKDGDVSLILKNVTAADSGTYESCYTNRSYKIYGCRMIINNGCE
uniref:Immunoglobulin V-set domain-containing protein n=1 Tax=Amphilophus citrinellus TaxID=61819 RepID=A0A3Q0QXJ1_AMPCI